MKIELMAAAAVAGGGVAPLFAQEGGTPTTIAGAFIVISLSMSALIGLIVKSLLADAKEDRAKFTAALKDLDAAYAKRAEAMDARFEVLRGLCQKEQDEQREAFRQEQRDARDHQARETAELRALVMQLGQGFRTAVHDVKDTAQSAIIKTTIAREGGG